jgi:hypothetical protein
MGDRAFRGFQCLNKSCTNFLFVDTDSVLTDFEITCDKCGFCHKAGEVTALYSYELLDERDGKIIEAGSFEILHDDYVLEAEEFKYCIICGALKPLNMFGLHSARVTGRQGECRICKQVYNTIKNQTRLVEQHREASQKRRLYTYFEDPTKLDIAAIYDRFECRCFKCGIDLSSDLSGGSSAKLGNLDHTLPVYYLWPLTTNNATLLCRNHNGAKAEKWPGVFYSKQELRRLSALTGVDYRLMEADPTFNPEAIAKLQESDFVESLFLKFARYPDELLRLRNRVLDSTGHDFLDIGANVSADWKDKADQLRGRS